MSLIEVSGLTKSFRTYKKIPGFRGAVRGLFRTNESTRQEAMRFVQGR